MTEKRFTKDDTLMFSAIKDNGKPMKVKEVVDLLNTLYEKNLQIKKVLQKYFDYYTRRAIEGRPYGDVTDAVSDIADELGVDLE